MDGLWKKTKKHTQRQIASFTLLTKVFILVKSWRGAIRDFREYAKWKCGFGYPGVQIIYKIAIFYFLWSPVTQWPCCGNALLPCSEKSDNPCSQPAGAPEMCCVLLLAAAGLYVLPWLQGEQTCHVLLCEREGIARGKWPWKSFL